MTILEVIEKAYDSTITPENWQITLDKLVEYTEGAVSSGLLLREQGGGVYQVSHVSAAYRKFLPTPDGQYYLNELAALEEPEFSKLARQPRLRIFKDTESDVPLEIKDKRADYVMLREHLGMNRRIAFRLNENPSWFDAITIGFDSELKTVPDAAEQSVRAVQSHLAKAIELMRIFSLLKARYQAVLSVLDRLALGVVIVLPSSEVLVKNQEAERIFDAADGLGLDRYRRLSARDPDKAQELRAAIESVCRSAGGEGNDSEKLIQITRPSGRPGFVVDMAPVGDSTGELGHALHGGIVFLIDPDRPPEFDIPKFAELYGLSAAEVEVLALIVIGDTSTTIAEKRGTAVDTAKNQVKSIFSKTDCSSRIELFRRIARTLPPII